MVYGGWLSRRTCVGDGRQVPPRARLGALLGSTLSRRAALPRSCAHLGGCFGLVTVVLLAGN